MAKYLRRAFAATVEEAGFCPVIKRPSTVAKGCQFAIFSKMAPNRSNSSSTRKGTTWVSFTASSSPFVNPVTRLPLTIGTP